MSITLGLRWYLHGSRDFEVNPDMIVLLDGVALGGNLRYAAKAAELSYRHAWGLLKHWEQNVGEPLVSMTKGRGAVLTPAGEALRQTWHKTAERLHSQLEDAAHHAELALANLLHAAPAAPLRICASHGFGIARLRDLLREKGAGKELEVRFLGSEASLQHYAQGDCDLAGFHLPLGDLGKRLLERFQPWLNPKRDVLLAVETRELGFMSRPDVVCTRIEDLARLKLRFINRQAAAGSRLIFDLLLKDAALKPAQINGYHNEEYTHSAVATMIASNGADVGFGARAAAEQFHLRFTPVVTERYFLILRRDALMTDAIVALRRILAGRAYQRQLTQTPGCDARHAGELLELKALTALFSATSKRPAKTARAGG